MPNLDNVILYGPEWSAYTRTVRLVLLEKEIDYVLEDVDFSNGTMPAEHFKLHPFGKVPVLSHGEFTIYETSAICRYLDAAFDGLALEPTNIHKLGRMAQVIAVFDAYLSEEIRMGYVSELLINPKLGFSSDEEKAAKSRATIEKAFEGLAGLLTSDKFFVGEKLTLADLHAAPLFDYLEMTPGGGEIIATQPRLRTWWGSIKTRTSMIDTAPDLSVFNLV